MIKRALDVIAGSIFLLLSLPVQAVVVILIRRDSPGPAYFRQKRIGYHGRTFEMLKFRTMQHGSDESFHLDHVERLKAAHGDAADMLRIPDDPRITRVGQTLRKGSFDELPNLLNVVRGDMSLVGPRPLVPAEAELLAGRDHRRHDVRPGMTGLAQIRGRDSISPEERNGYDLEYIEHQSLATDLKILALTLPAMFRNPGQ